MFKKVTYIVLFSLVLGVACKKDCINYRNFKVTNIDFKGNSTNIGLFNNEVKNSGDTIRSLRNQFYLNPIRDFNAQLFQLPTFDLIPSAYAAKDCAEIDRSVTSFDPIKTSFSIDTDINLADFGLLGIAAAGTNLLSIQELRDQFLSSIQNNLDIHGGLNAPVTIDPAFLKYFNGQTRTFTLKLTSTTGDIRTSSATVFLDVNV